MSKANKLTNLIERAGMQDPPSFEYGTRMRVFYAFAAALVMFVLVTGVRAFNEYSGSAVAQVLVVLAIVVSLVGCWLMLRLLLELGEGAGE